MLRLGRHHTLALGGSGLVEVVNIATSLGAALVLGRRLGPGGLGAYAVAMAISGMATALALPGLINASVVAVARGQRSFVLIALARRARAAVLVTLGVAAFGLWPWLPAGTAVWPAWALLGVATGVLSIAVTGHAVLIGEGRFLPLAATIAAGSGAGIALLLLVPSVEPIWFAVLQQTALAAASALLLVSLYCRELRASRGDPWTDEATSEQGLLSFGRSMSVVGAVGAVEMRADLILVGSADPAAVLGTYAVSRRLADALKQGWLVVSRVLMPHWSRTSQRLSRSTVERALLLASGVGLLIVALGGLASSALNALVFGSDAGDDPWVGVLLVAVAGVTLPGAVLETYFTSRAEARLIAVSRLGPGITYLILLPLAATVGGVVAVAGARLARSMCATAILAVGFGRRTRRGDSSAIR